MSKITELNTLLKQMEQLKLSIKPEDLTVEIDELVKQLETAGSTFNTLSQYGSTDILSNEKVKAALSVFGSTVKTVRGKIPNIEGLITFLGDGEKSKKDIAANFKCSEAHVNGFTKTHKDALSVRREFPDKKLSKLLYKVAPPKPAKKK